MGSSIATESDKKLTNATVTEDNGHTANDCDVLHPDLNHLDRAIFIVSAYVHHNKFIDYLLDLIKIIAKYYLLADQWSSEYKGRNMQILEGSDNSKVLKTKVCHQNIFGCQVITNGIFTWRIRVNKFKYDTGYWHLLIGVVNTDKADINYLIKTYNAFPSKSGCYTFDTSKGQILNEEIRGQGFTNKVTKSGDIMEITLNLETKSLHCKVNEEDVGISIDGLKDGEYRLLASLWFNETELEIL